MQKVIIPECDFDDYFDEHTKWKGYDYFKNNRVKEINKEGNTYNAVVSGSEDYKVSFKYEYGDITNMKCTCPLFEKGVKCKHLYAVIFKVFGEEREEERYTYAEMLHTRPVNEDNEINVTVNCDVECDIKEAPKKDEYVPLEKRSALYRALKGFNKGLKAMNNFFDSYDDTKKKEKQLEEEMDIYGLDDEEKELVRSGEWEPWQFDRDPDDLEEEDYYYEDEF